MKKKICFWSIIICLLIDGSVFAGERILVKYIKTSDGDTARVELNGENVRVRFLGINTPEVSGEDKVEEPFGNEALAYTKQKLDNAKKIEIEYDDVANHEDRFGRQLAWIWVDDALFEVELLEKGLAKTYMLKDNYRYASELKVAEQKAKKEKVGLWSEAQEEILETDNMSTTIETTNTRETESVIKIENEDKANDNWEGYLIVVIVVLLILYYLKNKK